MIFINYDKLESHSTLSVQLITAETVRSNGILILYSINQFELFFEIQTT